MILAIGELRNVCFLKQDFLSTLERSDEKQMNEQMMQTSYPHGAAAAAAAVAVAVAVAKNRNLLPTKTVSMNFWFISLDFLG